MLKWVMGDENCNKLMARYVQQFQNTPAAPEAFVKKASNIAVGDRSYVVEQWVTGSGVPELRAERTIIRKRNGYEVLGQVKPDLDLFKMAVELEAITDGDPE